MGTRNLTMVIDKKGDLKVAQYGQWDGYPEGQGSTILEFAKDKKKMVKLEEELTHTLFLNDNEYIKKWYEEEYCKRCPEWSSDPDLRTPEMKFWWEYLMTRDLGGNILNNIITVRDIDSIMFTERHLPKEHNNNIVLYNEIDFGKDSLMCEWAYCINFYTQKLQVFRGFNQDKNKEYSLFQTTQDEIEKKYKGFEHYYYGCKLIKEYDLNNLPTEEEFCNELNRLVQGEDDE